MQKFLICVDTSNDKKRAKLNKILLRFGERVQYSVFEFTLNEADTERLKQEIQLKIDANSKDMMINIYYLPKDYVRKIERFGKKNRSPIGDKKIVVF